MLPAGIGFQLEKPAGNDGAVNVSSCAEVKKLRMEVLHLLNESALEAPVHVSRRAVGERPSCNPHDLFALSEDSLQTGQLLGAEILECRLVLEVHQADKASEKRQLKCRDVFQ